MAESETDGVDNFTPEFKLYKRRDRPVDLSKVIDLRHISSLLLEQKITLVQPLLPDLLPIAGLKPASEWEIFHFTSHHGFYVIKNPFVSCYQRYWVARCLADLHLPPNVTNLSAHPDVNSLTVWTDFAQSTENRKGRHKSSPLRKLRWTTIGYHYNWSSKEYSKDHYTPFPEDIGMLARYVAAVLGFPSFEPQAGIINYYHLDSTLAGHTDHSELDHNAPLISVSFGQDAIFLLGGRTKSRKPTAIRLENGDICIMSSASRLAYHAVPRILSPTFPEALSSCFPLPASNLVQDRKCGVTLSDHDINKKSDDNLSNLDFKTLANLDQSLISEEPYSCSSLMKVNVSENVHKEKQTLNETENLSKKIYNLLSSIDSDVVNKDMDTKDAYMEHKHCPNIRKVNDMIKCRLKSLDWEPFALYLRSSRLNLNIRQVLLEGQTFPPEKFPEHIDEQCKKPQTDI